jgi:GNAT superfamily N-acetyltransferase
VSAADRAAGGGRTITTVVTYLEMTAAPAGPARPPPCPGVEVRRMGQPSVAFYRFLYLAVGEMWTWFVRRAISDEELLLVLRDPRVEVNVLWLEGTPAGYAELDRRAAPDIELAYFGLMPEFIGRGLGGYLLDWAIRHAWRDRPRRLWLHTCDLDHPRALGFYQRLGFRIYDRRTTAAELPPGVALPAAAQISTTMPSYAGSTPAGRRSFRSR